MGIVTVGRSNFVTFTEIAGTADATAPSRTDLRALADEQSAPRRVAELVAHGAALHDVFQAATIETANLVGSNHASLHRYARDGTATSAATYDAGHATTPNTGPRLTVPVVVEGHTWGVLTTSIPGSLVSHRNEQDLQQFAGLAAAAIANAENKAHLMASRARAVATADEARRRLQRDVHDGAQQRLVQTVITLKIAQAAIAPARHRPGEPRRFGTPNERLPSCATLCTASCPPPSPAATCVAAWSPWSAVSASRSACK